MKVFVTGIAGFIGYHVGLALLKNNHDVVGIDNINDYYDVGLKYSRLNELGIIRSSAEIFKKPVSSILFNDSLQFVRMNLEDYEGLSNIFREHNFDVVCNLAAQAGVRYSLENPFAYLNSNLKGFLNLLECCRNFKIKHLVYASSSSVYGLNKKIPFETSDKVDSPVSLYAATKKSNELMAHCYSHLYGFPTTGLRFFTVYGPWGRPDMAMFLFTEAILKKNPIKIFNNGNMERDFTFIDDIVEGVVNVIEVNSKNRIKSNTLYKIYNIGNNSSVKLLDFIDTIEKILGVKAIKEFHPIQPGDVEKTWANVDELINDFNYSPTTPVKKGIEEFTKWYKDYYNL